MLILQITVLQGPRKGEILAYQAESTIRIGRVIKGNDIALHDPGISEKHLCFRFVQEESRWFVSDLATSNGTILNGSPIQASVLVPVSDGDVLKIGEVTTLGVKIVKSRVLEEKEERNNSSRVSDEEAEQKEAQSRVPARGRGRGRERGRGKGKIVTRNSARALEEEKEDSRDLVTVSYSESEINESDQNRVPELRRNPTRGNSSRVLKELDANCEVNLNLHVKEVDMKRKGRERGKGKASNVSEEERENDENLFLDIDSESSDPNYAAIPELRKGIKAKPSANSSMGIEEKEGEGDVGVEEGGERSSEKGRVGFENIQEKFVEKIIEIFIEKFIEKFIERVLILWNGT